MAACATACLMLPFAMDQVLLNTERPRADFLPYALAGLALVVFFVGFLRFKKHQTTRVQTLWLAYLLLISVFEELAFRLLLPTFFLSTLGAAASVVLSNAIFAGIHYFSLRWKLGPCVFAFLGGIGFSRLLENTEDLVLVILVHWLATFLNTPRPPKYRMPQDD